MGSKRRVRLELTPELISELKRTITGLGYRGFSSKKKRIREKVAKRAIGDFAVLAIEARLRYERESANE
jgi:hypothetical protein